MIKMDFTNPINTYKEMMVRLYQNYVYHHKQNNYQTLQYALHKSEETNNSTIDDILIQDSRAALDRIKNTALNRAYRIKINKNINHQLDFNWQTINNDMLRLEQFYPARDSGSERRRSTLLSELFKVYKDRFDEQVNCWKDLQEPMRYFINLFHQYKNLKQDKKLLEER